MTTTLTPSDLVLHRARSDPQYYFERLLYLKSMDTEKVVRFILNAEQRQVMEVRKKVIAAGKPRRFIILKHRRPGMTSSYKDEMGPQFGGRSALRSHIRLLRPQEAHLPL